MTAVSRNRSRVALLATFVAPWLFFEALSVVLGGATRMSEPLHASVETFGAVLGLVTASLMQLQRRYERVSAPFVWTGASLYAMGVLELVHAISDGNGVMVWSRLLSIFVGSLFVAGVWLPRRWCSDAFLARLPLFALGLSGLVAIPLFAWPSLWTDVAPVGAAPWSARLASPGLLVRSIDVVSLVLFGSAALYFARRQRHTRHLEDLVFACQCGLLAVGVGFLCVSITGDASWWTFHAVWLLANLFLFRYVLAIFTSLQRHLAASNRGLESRVAAQTRTARESEERLRMALDGACMVAWEWCPATGAVVLSSSAAKVLGLAADARLETMEDILARVHRDDRRRVRDERLRVLEGQSSYATEFRWRGDDGVERWLRDQGRVTQRVDGAGMSGVLVDVTERRAVEAALRESEERLRLALQAGRLGSWETDLASGAQRISPEVCAIFGIEDGTALATYEDFLTVIHPEDRASVVTGMGQTITTGEPFQAEFRVLRPDGTQRWVASFGITLDGERSRATGLVADVTERKLAEQRIAQLLGREQAARADAERLYQQATQVNRMKDEFLATLSHELRTPLNVILGHTERLVGRDDLAPDIRSGTQAVHRAARIQMQLVSDLLDVSRIVSGKLTLESAPIELATLLEHAIETVRTAAHAKAIEMAIDLDPGAPLIVGDAARLQQVLWNLLANSVKFTPAGGRIHITSAARATTVELAITDDGQGIDRAFLPFVFDRFRQEDGTSTRQHGGLGLGLAIVRHVVEAHGGTVTVHSEGLGKGARFVVTLPRPPAVPTTATLVAASPPPLLPPTVATPMPLSGVRIAFVDDDDDARLLVQRVLRHAGGEVLTAASTRELYELLRTTPCHVLLCDIGMPDQDGFSVIATLRREERAGGRARIPAAALTAYSDPEDQERAAAAGFDAYLTKPFVAGRLIDVVAQLARR